MNEITLEMNDWAYTVKTGLTKFCIDRKPVLNTHVLGHRHNIKLYAL